MKYIILPIIFLFVATGCNKNSFSGGVKNAKIGNPNGADGGGTPINDRNNDGIPDSDDLYDSDGDGIGDTPYVTVTNPDGSTSRVPSDKPIEELLAKNNGGDVGTLEGLNDIPKAPLIIRYNAEEAGSNEKNKSGSFEFVLQAKGRPEMDLVTFSAGKKGKTSVPDVILCGRRNSFSNLQITAGGSKKTLLGWTKEVMATRARPSGDINDWEWFLDENKDVPTGKIQAYIGGFDAITFSDDGWCGVFACDEKVWSNRDDVMVIMFVDLKECPENLRSKTEFFINGMK